MHQFIWGFEEICFCCCRVFFSCFSYPDSDRLHMKQTFNFGKRKKSMLEIDEGCRLTAEPLEFCFSRETSLRIAPCSRNRCRCETTSCVPSKVPVMCLALFPMGAVKWLCGIIDTAFDLTTFENKNRWCTFYLGEIIVFFSATKHFSTECEMAAGGRQCTLPRQIFTRPSHDSNPRKFWTTSVLRAWNISWFLFVLFESTSCVLEEMSKVIRMSMIIVAVVGCRTWQEAVRLSNMRGSVRITYHSQAFAQPLLLGKSNKFYIFWLCVRVE